MPKRILVFIDWFLPGYKSGGPVTSVKNLIDHLHTDARFMIVTRDREYMTQTPYDVNANTWIDRGTYDVYYLSPDKLSLAGIRYVIEQTDFDLAYVNGMYSPFFSIAPVRIIKDRPVVVAARGMLAQSAIGIKSFKKRVFLTIARLSGMYRRVTFHATNSSEKEDIKRVFPKARVVIAANMYPFIDKVPPLPKTRGEMKLLFLGRVAPEKNTLFAIQSLSAVKEANVSLDICGSVYDESYWDLCQKEIAGLPGNITVSHIGTRAPYEIAETISNYHFLYLPSKGENFGHVILESILTGRPVIISDQTPWTHVAERYSGVVNINNLNTSARTIKELTDLSNEEYIELCKTVDAYAQNYVNNNRDREDNKVLFQLN